MESALGEEPLDNLAKNFTENFTENERAVLNMIASDCRIKTSEMAVQLGKSRRTIQTVLSKLKDKGTIHRVGPDKGGHWEIIVKKD